MPGSEIAPPASAPASVPRFQHSRMFGVPDYIVRVAVADAVAYEAFYMNELAELPGVGRVNSQFTMKLVKGA